MKALKTIQRKPYFKTIIIFFSFLLFSFEFYAQQLYGEIGTLKLESGEEISNCRIGYRLFGRLNSDSSNVVMYPTWFAGFSEQLAPLIGQGKLVDSSKYFVIAVDAFGNGISTSPGNSDLRENFPYFSMRDIVNAEYLLLTKILNLKKLHAAIGGSMGGMQVLQFAASYPGFAKKIVAYVPTPWASSYDKLLWQTRYQFIETSRKYNVSEKEIMSILNMLTQTVARTSDHFVKNNPRENFETYMQKFDKEPSKIFTSLDYMYQLKAMINHDVLLTPGITEENIKEKIVSEMFMIIAERDMILHPSPAKEFAQMINAKILLLDSDCGHLSVNCEMERVVKEIIIFLEK